MRRILSFILLVFLLAVPASAHPGDTDSSGGHYNRDTAEYHYHHGYSAHEHTDMDGDGDRDCPFDFDDQTGRSSGSSSGSSSSSSSSRSTTSTDYQRGYDAGHDDGYVEGKKYVSLTSERKYEEGYEAGEATGYAEGYREGYSDGRAKAKSITLGSIALSVSAAAIFVYACCRRDQKRQLGLLESRHAHELREMDRELRAVRAERDALAADQQRIQSDCRDQIDRIQTACQARLRELVQSHDAQLAEQTRLSDGAIVTLAYAKDAEIARLTAKVEECRAALERIRSGHAEELLRLEAAARENRLDRFLACFSSDELSDLDIPKDAELCGGTVSVGPVSRWRPFGDLTVYTAPSGKCYHMTRGCCGATTPNNRYELMLLSVPRCSKCGTWKDFLARCPDWYIRYKEIISGNLSERR